MKRGNKTSDFLSLVVGEKKLEGGHQIQGMRYGEEGRRREKGRNKGREEKKTEKKEEKQKGGRQEKKVNEGNGKGEKTHPHQSNW